MLIVDIILFVFGLALIIKGGDCFVDAAVWIAKALKIPTFIIGATIVSLATTMPELLVSSIAAAEGETEMAVGNAIGSVTANTAMILAIAMIAMTMICQRKQYFTQCLMLMVSAAVILCGGLIGGKDENGGYSLHFVASIVLILIFIFFMTENLISAKKKHAAIVAPDAALPEKQKDKPKLDKKILALNIFLFILGAAGIVGGSQLLVDKGEIIAAALGVPDRIIAVTLVAVGTSLPELVTTITAIVKKEAALSVGNVIGANVIDLTLILPISSLIARKQLPISADSLHFDIPVCLGVCVIAMLPLIIRQKSSKVQGIVLLSAYAGYIGYLIYSIIF